MFGGGVRRSAHSASAPARMKQHVQILLFRFWMIVFRSGDCIIRAGSVKVKSPFPAASHSFTLWFSLFPRLNRYKASPLRTILWNFLCVKKARLNRFKHAPSMTFFYESQSAVFRQGLGQSPGVPPLFHKQRRGQIAVAGIGQQHDDVLARVFRALGQLNRPHRPPRRRKCPPARPRCGRSARPVGEGVLVLHGDDLVVDLRVQHLRHKARADALNLVRARPCRWLSTGEAAGSTATTCTCGFCALRYAPTPVIVPPVPTPATKISTVPSVSAQISGPVVARVHGGVGRVDKLAGDEAVRESPPPAPPPWRWRPSCPSRPR